VALLGLPLGANDDCQSAPVRTTYPAPDGNPPPIALVRSQKGTVSHCSPRSMSASAECGLPPAAIPRPGRPRLCCSPPILGGVDRLIRYLTSASR